MTATVQQSDRWHVWEDSGVVCLSRVVGESDALVTQASLSALTYKVYRSDGTLAGSGTCTIANVIFDTAQTGSGWPWADAGFNFRFVVPASCFPSPGEYRIEFKYDPASGEDFHDVFEHVIVHDLMGS